MRRTAITPDIQGRCFNNNNNKWWAIYIERARNLKGHFFYFYCSHDPRDSNSFRCKSRKRLCILRNVRYISRCLNEHQVGLSLIARFFHWEREKKKWRRLFLERWKEPKMTGAAVELKRHPYHITAQFESATKEWEEMMNRCKNDYVATRTSLDTFSTQQQQQVDAIRGSSRIKRGLI